MEKSNYYNFPEFLVNENLRQNMKRQQEENLTESNPKRIKKFTNNFNNSTVTKDADSTNVRNNKQNKKNNIKGEKVKFEKSISKKFPKQSIRNLPQKNNLQDMKKEDWQAFKKKKKDLKQLRKEKKLVDLYKISIQAKKLSEKLRRSDCTTEERKTLTKELHGLLKSHYNKIIFTHDMSRIIQWILKYCQHDIRNDIFNELKPSLMAMTERIYTRNCIKALLKYGDATLKKNIISEWYGNIVNLMSHRVSAPLVELAYSTWASNEAKINFKQEFYGDMYKNDKDKNVEVLSDAYKNAEGMKSAILSAVKTNIIKILNKKFIDSVLLHTVIWEFLTNCSNTDRNEMIVMLRSFIVNLSKTKFGAKVAMFCIWHGNNKDRKIIMKAMKDNVKSIAMSEHGYMVLLALIDSVDDTVLVRKIILSEILKDLTEVVLNEYGKHVILYLVARRDPHYFPPSMVECLREGDNNETSKKPADVREKELREAIINTLLESIITETAVWLSKGSTLMVTIAILKVGSGEKLNGAFQAIATFITNAESKIVEEDIEYNIIEHSGLHMMLKKLIKNDKDLDEKGEITFGSILVDHITKNILEQWIRFNKGCFLLILLIENEPKMVVSNLLSILQELLENIKKEETIGASILLKKVQAIK